MDHPRPCSTGDGAWASCPGHIARARDHPLSDEDRSTLERSFALADASLQPVHRCLLPRTSERPHGCAAWARSRRGQREAGGGSKMFQCPSRQYGITRTPPAGITRDRVGARSSGIRKDELASHRLSKPPAPSCSISTQVRIPVDESRLKSATVSFPWPPTQT